MVLPAVEFQTKLLSAFRLADSGHVRRYGSGMVCSASPGWLLVKPNKVPTHVKPAACPYLLSYSARPSGAVVRSDIFSSFRWPSHTLGAHVLVGQIPSRRIFEAGFWTYWLGFQIRALCSVLLGKRTD